MDYKHVLKEVSRRLASIWMGQESVYLQVGLLKWFLFVYIQRDPYTTSNEKNEMCSKDLMSNYTMSEQDLYCLQESVLSGKVNTVVNIGYKTSFKEVSRRLSSGWMGQETVFTGLQNDETNLTSLTVDLLQTDSQDTFIKGTAGIHDRYADVHTRISDFRKTWAKNSINMDSEINGILNGGPNISFRQKTLFFNDLTTPMTVEKFVTEPTLGPSTTIRYKLKVLRGPRYLLWETKTDSLKGLELNTMETFKFEAGQRYLLKLHPTVLCHMSDQRKQETEHPPSHMLIIMTPSPVWTTPGPGTDSKRDSDEDEYEEDD